MTISICIWRCWGNVEYRCQDQVVYSSMYIQSALENHNKFTRTNPKVHPGGRRLAKTDDPSKRNCIKKRVCVRGENGGTKWCIPGEWNNNTLKRRLAVPPTHFLTRLEHNTYVVGTSHWSRENRRIWHRDFTREAITFCHLQIQGFWESSLYMVVGYMRTWSLFFIWLFFFFFLTTTCWALIVC
jgi:hypothetical protein